MNDISSITGYRYCPILENFLGLKSNEGEIENYNP